MYSRFGKVFYFFSVLVFLLALLYIYAALPEQIGFRLDNQGGILRDFEKNSFFYGLAFGFLLLNLVTLYTPKTLETKTNQKLHRLFPVGDPFRDYLLAWFYSFGGWVNFIYPCHQQSRRIECRFLQSMVFANANCTFCMGGRFVCIAFQKI
jgi:hypothetical protein